jgi:putative membrane protein
MVSIFEQIKRFIIGTIVGVASMLPGVSGGIIAVCFGIYERLIADLADLRHRLKMDFVFISIIGLGILFGMVISAFGLDYLMNKYLVLALFFFFGLIIGQIPELWNITKPKNNKFNKYNVIALIIGFSVMLVILKMGIGEEVSVGHNIWSYLCLIFVGVVIAVSKLAPGISGSAILLALGLYQPLMNAVTNYDWALLIPLGIGLIVGILGFAKVINYALNYHRISTYCAILGLTVGSVIVIFSYAYAEITSVSDVLGGILAILIGVGMSMLFVKIGKISFNQNQINETL